MDQIEDWDKLTINRAIRLIYYHKGVNIKSPILIAIDEIMEFKQCESNNNNSNYSNDTVAGFNGYFKRVKSKTNDAPDNADPLYRLLAALGKSYNEYNNNHPLLIYVVSSLFNSKFETISDRPLFNFLQDLLEYQDMYDFLWNDDDWGQQLIKDETYLKAPNKYEAYMEYMVQLTHGFPSQFTALYEFIFGTNSDPKQRSHSAKENLKYFIKNPHQFTKSVRVSMIQDALLRVHRLIKYLKSNKIYSMIEFLGINCNGINNDDAIEFVVTTDNEIFYMEDLSCQGMAKVQRNQIVFPPVFLEEMENALRFSNTKNEVSCVTNKTQKNRLCGLYGLYGVDEDEIDDIDDIGEPPKKRQRLMSKNDDIMINNDLIHGVKLKNEEDNHGFVKIQLKELFGVMQVKK